MNIRPILSTLFRHKTAAALIIIEIALSCAIICNALFLISGRLERMRTPTGVAESELVRVQLTGIASSTLAARTGAAGADALTATDLASLRALPGVRSASMLNQIPLGRSSSNSSVRLNSEQTRATLSASVYLGDAQLPQTLGLQLIAGRTFNANEMMTQAEGNSGHIAVAIVTRAMAQKLYPDALPNEIIGKSFVSWSDDPTRIVGIVERLVRPNRRGTSEEFDYSMIFPIRVPYTEGGNYMLRVDPARRAETIDAAVAALKRNSASRVILKQETFDEVRTGFYQQDKAMAGLLAGVCVALLVVTALGIVGLASFWVQQRTKQIGIRRALGATRGQVLRYFQTENFLLASIGIVLGMLLAFAINQLLMSRYELPRLPLLYLPVGALLLWGLGQLAVLGPARRAAAVPPATATRSA